MEIELDAYMHTYSSQGSVEIVINDTLRFTPFEMHVGQHGEKDWKDWILSAFVTDGSLAEQLSAMGRDRAIVMSVTSSTMRVNFHKCLTTSVTHIPNYLPQINKLFPDTQQVGIEVWQLSYVALYSTKHGRVCELQPRAQKSETR